MLNRNSKPTELKRYKKNTKQKKIIIGTILLFVLVLGGIKLYRTFALYKEEKSFNVLKGIVPDFHTYYKESILNGAYPELKGDLIPVTIDEEGTVRKADINKPWYSYEKQEWANAIILAGDKTGDNYQDNEQIPESDIESYFVWIPKYKYKIFDMGKYTNANGPINETKQNKAIEIKFGLENTIDDENKQECKTPNVSGEDGKCQEGKWMTHPAFTAFNGSKGMWVGKFETGYNQNENENDVVLTEKWTTEGANKNIVELTKVIIKPNVYSWREINLGNMYRISYNYQRNLDSHMMKNTEWGAVAYLTQSIYGTCDINSCTEIRINNSSNKVTGVSAINAPSNSEGHYQEYNKTTPNENNNYSYVYPGTQKSSTTLNNTGIFDMSGGSMEYVMGAMTSVSNAAEISLENTEFNKSGLSKNDIEDIKYIDLYITGTNAQYNRRILGDATGEMGAFAENKSSYFNDEAYFIQDSMWFRRGGYFYSGMDAGIFSFAYHNGMHINNFGFRIVLTP